MKMNLKVGCLLSAALLAASCATPSVTRLNQPVTGQPETGVLLHGRQLTGGTRALLEEKGLSAAYRKKSDEVISALKDGLTAGSSDAERLAVAELCSDTGTRMVKSDPRKAVGYFLAAAGLTFEDALKEAGNADSPSAALYNHSAGEVAKIIFQSGDDHGVSQAYQGPWKSYQLRHRVEGGSVAPDFFDELESADYLELKNYEMERYRQPGIGAAMVGRREGTAERRKANPFLSPIGMSVPVNAALDFRRGGDAVELRFSDLMVKEEIVMRGRRLPLASDLTVPIAVQVKFDFHRKHGFRAMTHPDDYVGHTGLYLLEPFRKDQIPVIFVHGLMSKPEVWIEALNRLRADPVLVRKYQLLVYRYPTGYPIIYNIATLRKQLAAFQEHFDPGRRNPNMRRVMVVGHSMGSVISNSVIRGSGDAFTDFLFDRPIDELEGLEDDHKVTLKDLLIYDASPNVTRAVFLAGPFRGSNLATGFVGGLGRSLIKLPGALLEARPIERLMGVGGLTEEGLTLMTHRPDSIGSLKPDAPVLEHILKTTVRKGVTVHTIIGRRNPKQPLEESSDGTVPYTSAHLDEAVSEKVVHAKHSPLCKHPETLEELRRILYLHAGLGEPR